MKPDRMPSKWAKVRPWYYTRRCQRPRADERARITAEARRLQAIIPADYPEGARASFADWLENYYKAR